MNPIDEIRYLDQLLQALSSGRMRLVENGVDVTERELGHLSGEIAAIEAMLRSQDSGRHEH
jgi:hypothetical protein